MCQKYQHFIVKQKVFICLDSSPPPPPPPPHFFFCCSIFFPRTPPPPPPPVYVLYTQFNVDVYGRPLSMIHMQLHAWCFWCIITHVVYTPVIHV